jgi:type IV secretory pathway TraG/TraD family ATPase VirD4
MNIIDGLLGLIVDIFGGIFGMLFSIFKELLHTEKNHDYTAEFGDPDEQLSQNGDGFKIGSQYGVDAHSSNSHAVVLGGSGSNKSTTVGFCTLLQSQDCSYVVFDISKEYKNGTAAYLRSRGFEVNVLDFDDYENSIAWNVFDTWEKESDIHQSIRVLFDNTFPTSNRDYWIKSAETIVNIFTVAIWKHAPIEFRNMVNVKNMLQTYCIDAAKIDDWITSTGDEKIIKAYFSAVSAPEKTLMSSIATASEMLAVFDLPNIAAITSKSTIAFDEFRTGKKKILYLCGSPGSMRVAKVTSASFFEAFFDYILKELPKPDMHEIRFIVDEAAAMKLNLSQILALGRKARISIVTLWQDYNQIEHLYGKNTAENIMANSRLKVWMPSGQPLATCAMLSTLLGKMSYQTEEGATKTRELLTPQEVFQLDKILVLNANAKPLLLPVQPFYENKKLLAYSKLPPYVFTGQKLSADVPLLKF